MRSTAEVDDQARRSSDASIAKSTGASINGDWRKRAAPSINERVGFSNKWPLGGHRFGMYKNPPQPLQEPTQLVCPLSRTCTCQMLIYTRTSLQYRLRRDLHHRLHLNLYHLRDIQTRNCVVVHQSLQPSLGTIVRHSPNQLHHQHRVHHPRHRQALVQAGLC